MNSATSRLIGLFVGGIVAALSNCFVAAQVTSTNFIDAVTNRVLTSGGSKAPSKRTFKEFCDIETSAFANRALREYGAVFVAGENIKLPDTCIFQNDEATRKFQSGLQAKSSVVGGVLITLQTAAMDSLLVVVQEATQLNIKVVPLDGSIAASRTYSDSVNIWESRFDPALRVWTARGKISADDANAVAGLPVDKRIEKVIEWESHGMLFGTGRRTSIFSSTAPPGASQHLLLLAFDVSRQPTALLIALFNSHGWFQTVKGDPQHFTYLGLLTPELPKRGLRQINYGGTTYWVPDTTNFPAFNRPN
jgi:hypothetical protein